MGADAHQSIEACTVASEVFTEAQSFADCKLHIRTRLSAFGSQQFLEHPSFVLTVGDG
jgi:hypothetical protein